MFYVFLIFLIFSADMLSKSFVKGKYPLESKKTVVKDKLYIWHVKNTGVAGNKFAGKTNGIIAYTMGLMSFILFYFVKFYDIFGKITKCGFAMLLGGAAGNLVDRIKNKSVTDFLYVKGKNSPIFNIADVFIFLGSFIIVVDILRDKKV